MICPIGLEVQKIHACTNDYILYHGKYAEMDKSPVCETSRYKSDSSEAMRGDMNERSPQEGCVVFPYYSTLKEIICEQKDSKADEVAC